MGRASFADVARHKKKKNVHVLKASDQDKKSIEIKEVKIFRHYKGFRLLIQDSQMKVT